LRNAQGIALDTRVEDINTYGDCVGWAYDEEVEQYAAVRWVGDVISRIDLQWEGSALGHELNDAGEVFIATTESLIVWRDGDYRVLEEYAPGRDVPTELTNAGWLVGADLHRCRTQRDAAMGRDGGGVPHGRSSSGTIARCSHRGCDGHE
jgi:hypothetical protein